MRHVNRPYLIKRAPNMRDPGELFHTGSSVPQTGIYRVTHGEHRLPHSVTLFSEEQFPRCAKCKDAVTFELLREATEATYPGQFSSSRIVVYELPVDDEEQDVAS